jgi:hypothetical protein
MHPSGSGIDRVAAAEQLLPCLCALSGAGQCTYASIGVERIRGPRGVTLIDDLDDELAAMETGVARAAEIAAGAENSAADVAARVATVGFTGIAQAMGLVRAGIAEVRARIVALIGAVNQARRSIAAASTRIVPQQAIDVLAPIEVTLGAIHDGIGATIVRLGEVQRAAAATLQGGRPGPMLARLEGIRTVLIAVGERTHAAQRKAEAALVEARTAGSWEAAGDVARQTEDTDSFDPTPYLDDMPKHVPPVRQPGWSRQRQKTHGRHVVKGGPAIKLLSGEFGEDYRLAVERGWTLGLSPRPWEFVKASHIELKFAAQMYDKWQKTKQPQHETIVLNNEPCAVNERDCEFLIDEFLPIGSTLTVYAPDGFCKTYYGKGS